MMITPKRLEYCATIISEILPIAEAWFRAKRKIDATISVEEMGSFYVEFKANWTEGCRGHYESYDETFSLTFDQLSAKDWKAELEKEIELEKKKAAEAKKKQVEATLRAREKAEKAQYELLKKKFEK